MFGSHRGSIVTLLRELIAKSSLSELRHAREEPRGLGAGSVGCSARGDPDPAPRERARSGAGAAGGPRTGISGTDSTGAAAAKAAPAPQSPVGVMGQPRNGRAPGSGSSEPSKHPPAAAPWLSYHRCGQERDLPRMPAVPPASLLRCFSLNPEKEGPLLLSSHPRPLHSEPAPACLPSLSSALTLGAPGLASRAGKERDVGVLFFSLFLPSLPTPPQPGKGVAS